MDAKISHLNILLVNITQLSHLGNLETFVIPSKLQTSKILIKTLRFLFFFTFFLFIFIFIFFCLLQIAFARNEGINLQI